MNKIEQIKLNWESLIFTHKKFEEAEIEVEDALDNFMECEDKSQVRANLDRFVNLCEEHAEIGKKFAFDSNSLLKSVECLTEEEREKNVEFISSLVKSLEGMLVSTKSLENKISQIKDIVVEVFNEENK